MEEDSKTHSENSNDCRSPLLFSSDEDSCSKDDEDASAHFAEQQASQPIIVKENAAVQATSREAARLDRLQTLLQGVPPPPSVTIPQIDCNEVITLWKKNKNQLEEAIKQRINKEASAQKCLYNASITEQEMKNLQWPDVRHVQYPDIYYNISHSSEEMDRLSQKLQERFVGAETSTWCNGISNDRPGSAKKRQKMRGWGQVSPGGRLSHLARRRQMFSSAGLQQLMTNASKDAEAGTSGTNKAGTASRSLPFRRSAAGLAERRCIVLDTKKVNTRKSARGSSAKKRVASAAKEREMPKLVPNVQVKPAKRALFQSPEDNRPPVLQPSTSKDSPKNRALRSKRALWPSTSNPEVPLNENGKRVLESDSASVSQASKLARGEAPFVRSSRSLPSLAAAKFAQNEKVSDLAEMKLRRLSCRDSTSDMSELHKRKLLWAVSTALRSEGITPKHPEFRPCATKLAQYYDQIRREWTGPPPSSTSAHMLLVSESRVAEVVRAHRNSIASVLDPHSRQSGIVKELFRDATSSLNVRSSIDTLLTSQSRSALDTKKNVTRKIPSARKSLTFENFEDDASLQWNKTFDTAETKSTGAENKGAVRKNDARRALFGSENDGSRQTAKSESHEGKKSSAEEIPSAESESSLPRVTNHSSDTKGVSMTEKSASADRVSESEGSLPKVTNHSSDTKGTSASGKSSSSVDVPQGKTSNAEGSLPRIANHGVPVIERSSVSSDGPQGKSSSAEGASSESHEEAGKSGRRRLKRTMSPCERRVTRRTWASKRNSQSAGNDSDKSVSSAEHSSSTVGSFAPPLAESTSDAADKDPANSVTQESDGSKAMESAAASSPPFFLRHSSHLSESVNDGSCKEPVLNGGPVVATASADVAGDASTSLTAGSSKNRGSDQLSNGNLESNVITPILEATATDVSLDSKGKEGAVANGDLSFSGRIQGLKPAEEEKENNADLGTTMSASACLLDEKEEEKGPDLTRWAEMATRGMNKDSSKLNQNQTNDYVKHFSEPLLPNGSQQAFATSASADESSYPWLEQSQLTGNDSQCPNKLYEQYKSIFDSSSQEGDSQEKS